jgi:hypothetical protein
MCGKELKCASSLRVGKFAPRPNLCRALPLLFATLLLASNSAGAQLSSCYLGFEVSQACIAVRGLDHNAGLYQRKIDEAMPKLGASYKITLRIVNHPVEAGYETATIGDVFTEVVRDEEMRNEAFIVNVTADFLEHQPEILFESSSLHEVCHIMNDDLTGYNRNGANVEVAEEACVLQAVGLTRYEQFLRAYAVYQHWDSSKYDDFLQMVKTVALVPAPNEMDDADRCAADYFRTHADGLEHLIVFNGDLHEISLYSTKNRVSHDPDKLEAVIKAGKPMVFFHNHPADGGRAAMFPSYDDFGVAGLFSFTIYAENLNLPVEFRVVQPGDQGTIVSYGFKKPAVAEIKKLALEYRSAIALTSDIAPVLRDRDLLVDHLAQDSFGEYLQHACPVDLDRSDAEVCRTHPGYFIWPSERFLIQYRGAVISTPERSSTPECSSSHSSC